MTTPLITVDSAGSVLEVTVWPSAETAGLSVLVPAQDWLAVVARAEELEPVRSLRQRERREAHSHGAARASRK